MFWLQMPWVETLGANGLPASSYCVGRTPPKRSSLIAAPVPNPSLPETCLSGSVWLPRRQWHRSLTSVLMSRQHEIGEYLSDLRFWNIFGKSHDSPLRALSRMEPRHSSSRHRDDHLTEMRAAFLVMICSRCLGQREYPINYRLELVQGNRAIHGREHIAAPNEDAADYN